MCVLSLPGQLTWHICSNTSLPTINLVPTRKSLSKESFSEWQLSHYALYNYPVKYKLNSITYPQCLLLQRLSTNSRLPNDLWRPATCSNETQKVTRCRVYLVYLDYRTSHREFWVRRSNGWCGSEFRCWRPCAGSGDVPDSPRSSCGTSTAQQKVGTFPSASPSLSLSPTPSSVCMILIA
jgi:hypothetical protein